MVQRTKKGWGKPTYCCQIFYKFRSTDIAATVALQPGRRRSKDNFIAVSLSGAPRPTQLNIILYIYIDGLTSLFYLISDFLSHFLPFFLHLAVFLFASFLGLPDSLQSFPLRFRVFFFVLGRFTAIAHCPCKRKKKKNINRFPGCSLKKINIYVITVLLP
jgi:hypothetical protein